MRRIINYLRIINGLLCIVQCNIQNTFYFLFSGNIMIQLHQKANTRNNLSQNNIRHPAPTAGTAPSAGKTMRHSIPLMLCALLCACSSEIAQDFSSFKDMCEASGGTFVSNNICKCDTECPDGVICVEGKCASECKQETTQCRKDNKSPNAIFEYCSNGE